MAFNAYQKVISFILFIFALLLFFKLIQPVIVIILSSVILAYISFPLYIRINKKIPNKSLSIVLSLIIISTIILIPVSFFAIGVAQQGYYFYNSLSGTIAKGTLFGFGCESTESKICLILNQAEKFSLEQLSKFGIDKQLQKFLPILEQKITNILLSFPITIAKIFLALIITYFILKERERLLKKVINLIPIRKKAIKKLVNEFGNITHTVIYAQLLVALVQGIIGAIGFYIFGVPFPILSGVLIAFAALLPAIGTSIIWLPASLYLILLGYFSQDYWILGKGIGLLFYGFLIISTIDNFLLAKIVNSKTKVNQITVIVGVIGGASMFGVPGIFIGPILLPLLITYFETFKERFY